MRPFGRNSRRVLVLGVTLSALAWCLPTFASGLQQGFADIAELMVDRLAREQARSAKLDAQIEACLRRMEGRKQAIDQLMGGRLTLVEAAARFRDLDAPCPDDRRAMLLFHAERCYPAGVGRTYEECLCWNVIAYLQVEEKGKPGSAMLWPRLKAELRQKAEGRTSTLPE